MKAGERHPRNYYAWLYARNLLRELAALSCRGEGDVEKRGSRGNLAIAYLAEMHGWCLKHPRDISGWTFLKFLLDQVRNEQEVRKASWETKEFVKKYGWRGESIEWFLKSLGAMTTEPQDETQNPMQKTPVLSV